MNDIDRLVRDLKGFENKKTVLKELRKEIRKPIPAVRKAIKESALETMSRSGGLNLWVARERVTAVIKTAGRAAGVTLKGSRKSAKGKSDLRRLDAGRLRHPSWGRRGRGDWHTQTVTEGYFTRPAANASEWRIAVKHAMHNAIQTIAKG